MPNNLVFHSDPKKSHGIPKAEKAFNRWVEEKQKHLLVRNVSLKLAFVIVKDCKGVEMLLILAMDKTELGIEIYDLNWLGPHLKYKSLFNWKKAIEGEMFRKISNTELKAVKFTKRDKEFISFFKAMILEIELPLAITQGVHYSKEHLEFNKGLYGLLLPNNL